MQTEPNAEVITDTRDPETGVRVVTVQADIPTALLAQLNTHGVFSKSAQSARAVPVRRMLTEVPAYLPTFYGHLSSRGARGMSDGERLPEELQRRLQALWCDAEKASRHAVEALCGEAQAAGYSLSKGVVNRVLAPYRWTRVVLTALDDASAWGWLRALRVEGRHGEPQGAMHAFSLACVRALDASTPRDGVMHIPYDIGEDHPLPHRIMHSAGRCAGVSYRREPSAERAQAIGDRMREEGHLVPFEHVCFTRAAIQSPRRRPLAGDLDGLRGRHWRPYARPSWLQVRKLLEPVELNGGGSRVVDPWRVRARVSLGLGGRDGA